MITVLSNQRRGQKLTERNNVQAIDSSSSDPVAHDVIDNPYASSRASYYALGILTLVYSFAFIDRQLLAILQESIKADLGLSDSHLGLLTGFAFALFYVTAGIPIARLADNSSRLNIVSISIFVWSFMTAISGAAQNFVQLLLARIGVGIGEAGGNAPSQSMISDIFPPHKRATALGIYFTGVNIGIMFGFLLGGWLNEVFGWRMAFVIVGVPGILLALIVRFTLVEPARGVVDNKTVGSDPTTFREVVSLLWKRRSFRHLAMGNALAALVVYGVSSWIASYMIRSHGMDTTELGLWLAMILGVGGAIGVLTGGFASDRLGVRDKRWYVWIPGIAGLISLPLGAYVYLAETAQAALLFAVIPGILSVVFLGPTMAAVHALVGSRMRAMSSAITSLIVNIIGLGGGPFIIGVLSDYLEPSLGNESLRYAMLCVIPVAQIWACSHFFLASKTLREDMAAAPE